MTGPKLNEGSRVVGERVGTRASAQYVRMSASKVRVVLDLVRGQPVRKADEVLQFTEREAARVVRKILASAVANAVHNDEQDPDELYVHACFADEGPTLRRFKPRARGRATRIRKRTCHITLIVARMSEERLTIEQARAEGGGGMSSAAAARRARVERSRQRAAQRASGGTGATDELDGDHLDDIDVEIDAEIDDTAVEDAAVDDTETDADDTVDTADDTSDDDTVDTADDRDDDTDDSGDDADEEKN